MSYKNQAAIAFLLAVTGFGLRALARAPPGLRRAGAVRRAPLGSGRGRIPRFRGRPELL